MDGTPQRKLRVHICKGKENIDEFRETIYKKVRELHIQKYPYNDFPYEVE